MSPLLTNSPLIDMLWERTAEESAEIKNYKRGFQMGKRCIPLLFLSIQFEVAYLTALLYQGDGGRARLAQSAVRFLDPRHHKSYAHRPARQGQLAILLRLLLCGAFYLALRKEIYEQNGKSLSYNTFSGNMTQLKESLLWPKEVHRRSAILTVRFGYRPSELLPPGKTGPENRLSQFKSSI